MKSFGKTFKELEQNAPKKILSVFMKILDENELFPEEYENQTLDYLFGGEVFLVEEKEDLKQILTIMPGVYLFDSNSAYDIYEVLPDKTYLMLCLITNNSGGNTYFIPYDLAMAWPTVRDSYQSGAKF
jgi:hypothetical protein